DLIIMATHGRSGMERLLLGSVAANVLQNADVPVLLARACAQGHPAPADEHHREQDWGSTGRRQR
ncbi:MAG: universal stress protein, partial [Roseiflexaceae bacterium]